MLNCTPHSITVVGSDSSTTVDPCGTVIRINDGMLDGDVPNEECIVSALVLDAWGWAYPQMRAPGPLVRDAAGQPTGCKGLRAWEGDRRAAALRSALTLDPGLAQEIATSWALVGSTDGQVATCWQARLWLIFAVRSKMLVRAGFPAEAVWKIWPFEHPQSPESVPLSQIGDAWRGSDTVGRGLLWEDAARRGDMTRMIFLGDVMSAGDIDFLLVEAEKEDYPRWRWLAQVCNFSKNVAHHIHFRLDCADDEGWEGAPKMWKALLHK